MSWKFKATFRLISEREIQFQAFLDFEITFTKRAFTSRIVLSIFLSINSILVNVDVIGGSYVNGKTKNTSYSFFPNASPGYHIVENPRNFVYLPVILDKISKMETVVTDQN